MRGDTQAASKRHAWSAYRIGLNRRSRSMERTHSRFGFRLVVGCQKADLRTRNLSETTLQRGTSSHLTGRSRLRSKNQSLAAFALFGADTPAPLCASPQL